MTGKTEAQVEIEFVGLIIKEFEVNQIEVINVPEGLDYDLLNEVLKIRLRGSISLINTLNAENIVLTVDLSGKEIGSFTIKPVLAIKGEQYATVGAVGSYSVSIAVKEAVPEETES